MCSEGKSRSSVRAETMAEVWQEPMQGSRVNNEGL